jgi:hypothetical protein
VISPLASRSAKRDSADAVGESARLLSANTAAAARPPQKTTIMSTIPAQAAQLQSPFQYITGVLLAVDNYAM